MRNITFANSQRKTNCGVCGESFIYENLIRHFEKFHSDQTPREKVPEGIKSIKTFFVLTNSSTVLDVFKSMCCPIKSKFCFF